MFRSCPNGTVSIAALRGDRASDTGRVLGSVVDFSNLNVYTDVVLLDEGNEAGPAVMLAKGTGGVGSPVPIDMLPQ